MSSITFRARCLSSTSPSSSSSAFARASPSSCAKRPDRAFLRLIFAGTPAFAEQALAALHDAGHEVALVLTQPDRPVGRGLRPAAGPVKRLALERAFPLYQPETLRNAEAIAPLKAAHADALVVAAYGILLPEEVLAATPGGGVNIHASLLPRWRGAAPIQRALLAGDVETGISIMQMDAGLDTGPVLARKRVPITADDDAGTLHDKLAALGAGLIVDTLADFSSARCAAVAQPREGATYARKIDKRETRLDWSQSAAELECAVRAFRPTPGATAQFGDHAVKIWAACVVDAKGAPGEVLEVGPGGIVVACGDGALKIAELQREGARRMPAVEFARGRRLVAGHRLE